MAGEMLTSLQGIDRARRASQRARSRGRRSRCSRPPCDPVDGRTRRRATPAVHRRGYSAYGDQGREAGDRARRVTARRRRAPRSDYVIWHDSGMRQAHIDTFVAPRTFRVEPRAGGDQRRDDRRGRGDTAPIESLKASSSPIRLRALVEPDGGTASSTSARCPRRAPPATFISEQASVRRPEQLLKYLLLDSGIDQMMCSDRGCGWPSRRCSRWSGAASSTLSRVWTTRILNEAT